MRITCYAVNSKMKFILILYTAFYFTDGDMAENTPAKANEFLIGDWKEWYKLFDVDKDGKVTLDDLEAYKLNFANLSNVGVDHMHDIASTVDTLWDAVVFNGKSEISEEEFVKKFKIRFKTDRKKLIATLYNFQKEWEEAIDLNNDSMLSKEEYLLNCKALGHDAKISEELVGFYHIFLIETFLWTKQYFETATNDSSNDTVIGFVRLLNINE